MNDFTLLDELKKCFNYFMDYSNFNYGSKGYGLTLDNSSSNSMCSLAASGFMLASIVIGVKHNLISYEEGKEKVFESLKSIYENVGEYKGLLLHFVKYDDASRHHNCEYSTIDTAIFLSGALVVDAFFCDSEISQLVTKFFNRIDWNYFFKMHNGKKVVRMAYNEYDWKTHKKYKNEEDGFIYQWDMYAEQLMMYLIIAGDDRVSKQDAKDLFNGFRRDVKTNNDLQFVRCPTGSLFTYQFTHCFFDFSKYLDCNNYDWFLNSKNACLDNYYYCKNNTNYETFKKGLWGVSASNGPKGYRGFGIPPYDYDERLTYNEKIGIDGTIAPYSIISSLPFIPEIALKTLNEINNNFPDMIGKYGYKDAINIDNNWIASNYYGIDKGASIIMIENYLNGTIWELFTNHQLIQKGIKKLYFMKR